MATYVDAKIVEGFATALTALGLSQSIAWPNVAFDSINKSSWVRVDFLPAETFQITLGDSGFNRYTGIMQATVYWREGQGMIQATEVASTIADGLQRGTTITQESQLIRVIRPPSILPATVFDGWLQIPVRVTYQTDAQNP